MAVPQKGQNENKNSKNEDSKFISEIEGKVNDMSKYLESFKEFNSKFQKSMSGSQKELWAEINAIKSKRRR